MLRILTVFLALLITLPAAAQEDSYEDLQAIPDALKEQLRYGTNFEEQFISSALQKIRTHGRTHKAIDREDIERIRKQALDRRRSQQYVQLLRFDLDYDGKITGTELRKVFMDEQGENKSVEGCNDLADRQMQKHDVDGDGEISLQEMAALSTEGRNDDGTAQELEKLLALDPDDDGKLTVEEMTGLARKAFATVDGDGDGFISTNESNAMREQRRASRFDSSTGNFRDRLEKLKSSCRAPQARGDDKVVFLNVYGGSGFSTHSVAGQDEETTVVDVKIMKGQTGKDGGGLHIVAAAAKPVIWHVTGETSRVAAFVAAGPAARGEDKVKAGVAGLESAKVTFVKLRDCIPVVSQDANSVEGIQAVAAVKAMAGRDVSSSGHVINAIFFEVSPAVTHASSAAVFGYRDIKDAAIVAGTKAEAYEVLPQKEGLGQLVKEGKIIRLEGGKDEFKIVKEIPRYPAGLTGAHAVRFILGNGIKPPEGDPGHSCVMLEETDQPLNARIANNCSRR